MAKQIIFGVVGVVVGIVVGMIAMMSLHYASMVVYAPPEGVDFMSQEPENRKLLREWFETLPTGAFLLATACHGLGCMAGAIAAMLVAGRRSLVTPVIVGLFFTVGGIMNLASIPHPAWFPFVDVPIYVVLAVVAGVVLKRKADVESPATEA